MKPGDEVLVPIIGRLAIVYRVSYPCWRYCIIFTSQWVKYSLREIIAALDKYQLSVLAIVHGETSTGRLQPIDKIGQA